MEAADSPEAFVNFYYVIATAVRVEISHIHVSFLPHHITGADTMVFSISIKILLV
jgi:hypothetical protein